MNLIKKTKDIIIYEHNAFENKDNIDEYAQLRAWRHMKDHPIKQVIIDIHEGVKIRNRVRNEVTFSTFIYEIEPSYIEEHFLTMIG